MIKKAKVQGFKVDLMSFDEVVETVHDKVIQGKNTHIVTINPEIIQCAKNNSELSKIIREAELITADGVGIKLALRMKGIHVEQVTGVDLSKAFIKLCADNGLKLALIGAKENVLKDAVSNIKKDYPNLNVAYVHDGYFDDFSTIVKDVVNSGAQFVLCAMGSPRQEFFISKLKEKIKGACMIGVGGTFDVLSGHVKLAPDVYRKIGLEWLYRTVNEPKRLKRIFPALPIFFFQSIIDSIINADNE